MKIFPKNSPSASFVLGGAQLGMSYGIANNRRYAKADATDLIRAATEAGVRCIDTASVYGVSEAVIGAALHGAFSSIPQVITKLDPIIGLSEASSEAIRNAVEKNIARSLELLRVESLDVLLLHRAEQMTLAGGIIWDCMRYMRDRGFINLIGISVQSPHELERVLEVADVGHVQLPFNLLDYRWKAQVQRIRSTRKRRDLTVHVRSALLQGLLANGEEKPWGRANVQNPQEVIDWLAGTVKEMGRENAADLALAYVRAQPWVDGVVCGCDSLVQFQENFDLFNRPTLTVEQLQKIDRERPRFSEATLDPSKWKR